MHHTVLVVDDQWSMQELARIVLQGAGYHVLLAGDGPTGLCLARTEHPSAAIVDMHLPGMDGPAVLRALQQDPGTARIPVILITPGTAREQLATGLQAGASGCLPKPFSAATLLGMLDSVLRRGEMPLVV